MSPDFPAHDRRRVWFKSALIGAALLAIPGYYIAARNLGRAELAAARAEWNAAGMPLPCGAELPASPQVPDDQNLLTVGIFQHLKSTGEGGVPAGPMADWDQWFTRMRKPTSPGTRQGLDLETPFRQSAGKRPALKLAAGETHAAALITAIQTDFPELRDLAALRASHPEIGLGLTYPPLHQAFSAKIVAFSRGRAAARILHTYAAACIAAGRLPEAVEVDTLLLAYAAKLAQEPTLSHRMLSQTILQDHAIPVLQGLISAPGADEAMLRRLATGAAQPVNPIQAVRRALVEEALIWPAYLEFHGAHGLVQEWPSALTDMRDWEHLAGALAGRAIPSGWFYDSTAQTLRLQIPYLQQVVTPAGDLRVAAITQFTARLEQMSAAAWNPTVQYTLTGARTTLLKAAKCEALLRAARLAIALQRHRLRHGEFPATLAALDPELIPAGGLPCGPLTGLPPAYTRLATGGFSLGFKKEDATETASGQELTHGRDLEWTAQP